MVDAAVRVNNDKLVIFNALASVSVFAVIVDP